MKRRVSAVLAVAALMSLALAVVAEETRMDIDVVETDSTVVFEQLATAHGASGLRLEGGSCGRLTMRLEHVRPEVALEAACDSLGCDWRLEGEQLVVDCGSEAAAGTGPSGAARLDERISLSLRDARLDAVVATLAQILEAELSVEFAADETVTVDIVERPAGEALDAICAQAGCTWRLEEAPRRLSVRRAGYGLELMVEPEGELPGIYRARAVITDLASGEVVSAPTITFRAGETAEVATGLPEGGVIALGVIVAPQEGGAPGFDARITQAGEVRFEASLREAGRVRFRAIVNEEGTVVAIRRAAL